MSDHVAAGCHVTSFHFSCENAVYRLSPFSLSCPWHILYVRGTLHSVEIGLPSGGTLAAADPWPAAKPVVWYGTSIVHGAAALHQGMVWTNQAGRMLRRPGLNLGFSGDGLMQPAVGAVLATLGKGVRPSTRVGN